jgi:hypothetical protein
MSVRLVLAVAFALATAHLTADQSSPASSAVLAAAREAIGMRAGGAPLRSIRTEGTRMTTQAVITDQRAGVYRSANREHPLALEIMPPDRYVRTATNGSVRREGLERGRTILESRELDPADSPWEHREPYPSFLEVTRLEFARLALALFGRADVIPGATLRDLGPHRVNVEAPNGTRPLVVTLDLDPATGLPARLSWRSRARVHPPNAILGKIADSGGGASRVDPGDLPEIEVAMTFSDHRLVSGFRLPFRVTTSATGVVLTELRFNTLEANRPWNDDDRP